MIQQVTVRNFKRFREQKFDLTGSVVLAGPNDAGKSTLLQAIVVVSEQTRNDIWQGLLDAARLIRYYEALAERYRRRHLTLRILLLLAAVSGMVSLLEVFPRVAQLVAGFGIMLLVALDLAFNLARKTSVLNLVNIECTALGNEWKSLWASLERVSDDDARRENDRLARRLVKVTGWAGHAEVGVDDALNEKCERVAYKVASEEYATG